MTREYASSTSKLAAIDIGTNSFHLIVVAVDHRNHRIKILEKEKKAVRLGGDGMRRLTDSVMDRGVRALKRFKEIADAHNAPVRAIATSAVREAMNRQEFIDRVSRKTGIRIEVISGCEEARLIYLGVLSYLPVFDKKILLVDIGGGSTEILIGKSREILHAKSLKMGALRLTLRFLNKETLDAADVARCKNRIDEMLAHSCDGIGRDGYDAAIGTSGTILNIARMIRFQNGGTDSINGKLAFSREELFDMVDRILAAKNIKKRAAIAGLDYGRVDIITAGALILKGIFKRLKIKDMTVSRSALREGIVLDTAEKWPLCMPGIHPVFRN